MWHRAKDRADAGQASKRSPIGDSPRHERCNRPLSQDRHRRKRGLFEVPISQYSFLPIELPPSPEQRQYERVQWMLQTRNPLIRAFRRFGGRGWLNRELNRSRKHADWTFPSGSSGPFGEDLPGRWLDHDELITTLKHLLEFKEQKRSSPFWHEQEYSFWVDVHGRVD